jgi:hypothetical protein
MNPVHSWLFPLIGIWLSQTGRSSLLDDTPIESEKYINRPTGREKFT